MKASELRERSADELRENLTEAQDRLFRLRFQSQSEDLDDVSVLRRTRRDIARIQTILREKAGETQ